MSQDVTQVKVFVISPTDVEDERKCLESAIKALHSEHSACSSSINTLVNETGSGFPSPGIGGDPQAVINNQIPNDVDIVIGIMWCRTGTPTPRAQSGTIEEFQMAKRRYEEDNKSMQIMFYFKNAPIPPYDIDEIQLKGVKDFRNTLEQDGILYQSFKTTDEFQALIGTHLRKSITRFEKSLTDKGSLTSSTPPHSGSNTPKNALALVYDDEPGILDLEDAIESRFDMLGEVMCRITEATKTIHELIQDRTQELESIDKNTTDGRDKRRKMRNVISMGAHNMSDYAARMETEVPLFKMHLDSGISSLTEIIPLIISTTNRHEERREAKTKIKGIIRDIRDPMDDVTTGFQGFLFAISSLPRLTVETNRAKRATLKVIQRLIDIVREAKQDLLNAENTLDDSRVGFLHRS